MRLPYGRETIEWKIKKERLRGVIATRLCREVLTETAGEMVRRALENPVASPRLCELAKDKHKVVIVTSDHTRAMPSRVTLPALLAEIRRGNPQADITILVATGLHRAVTREELIEKCGEELVSAERFVCHDCDDEAGLVSLGRLPSGGPLTVNRLAAEADLLVAEGLIEPHFFAGFSGGRKSILPGIAGRACVMYNHSAAMIDHPCARTGVCEGNPVHRDMLFAAEAAGLAFVLNVVCDENRRLVHAVAGDREAAHLEGVAYLEERCTADPIPADIVVSTNGGYPLDRNIYQAVKGMDTAARCVAPGGVIVMLAQAADGTGSAMFFDALAEEPDVEKLYRAILARAPEDTLPDQWQVQILARVLLRARVILVSDCDPETVRRMHLIPAANIAEAMTIAGRILGNDEAGVTVIPDGVSTVIRERSRV
ncbi:MAG: nickel-dependent lactate racemase [Clostridia bacterium]|nr:nickel-dependent lactate racemase [Clostridia bacterium]